jgi:Ca2+-binding EF-hand superfamily protein
MWVAQVLPEMPSEDHLREALQTFDKGNNGEIDIAEVKTPVRATEH